MAVTVTTPSPTRLCIERRFAAPPARVFAAHTQPPLLRRWLLGPGGWTMPVCEVDLRVGGRFRYEWAHPDQPGMACAGTFETIEPDRRLVHVEAFEPSWYPGGCRVETVFHPDGTGCRLATCMTFDSEAARDQVVRSPMAEGMDAGYDRLEALL